MNRVEIASATPMEWVRITVAGENCVESRDTYSIVATIDQLPAVITAEFKPFGIRPWVRYNNFLLNHWLAQIKDYDHMLEFTITKDFYNLYRQQDIQGRLAHLSGQETAEKNLHDKYIGINNLYPELVKEIQDLLA
jgi:hypothetical protein